MSSNKEGLLHRSRLSLKSRPSLRTRPSNCTSQSRSSSHRITMETHPRESLITSKGNTVVYTKYKWSENSTTCSAIYDSFMSFGHFLGNLSAAFGWKFVTIVIIIYGFQQGLGNALFFQARDYYFKDTLALSPAQAQAYTSASMTPWNGILTHIVYICMYFCIAFLPTV